MTISWLSLWLLSASWLFGLDYFFKATPAVWGVLVALGTAGFCVAQRQSLADATGAPSSLGHDSAARRGLWRAGLALLFVPAIVLLPGPARMAPVLLFGAVLIEWLLTAGRWRGRNSRYLAGRLDSIPEPASERPSTEDLRASASAPDVSAAADGRTPRGAPVSGAETSERPLARVCGSTRQTTKSSTPPEAVSCARWRRAIPAGLTLSGGILLAQTLAIAVYRNFTARTHELPWPLPRALAAFVRLIGVEAAASGSDLVVPTMRETHNLGATWELLLDPATVCFIAGGLVLVLLTVSSRGGGEAPGGGRGAPVGLLGRLRRWISSPEARAVGVLLLGVAIWLPARTGLQVGVFLHRALRTDYEAPFNLMNQFWSPWPQLLLLLPLALLVSRWIRGPSGIVQWMEAALALPSSARVRLLGLGIATAAVFTLAIQWDPVGKPKAGRIAVDEFHSKWEPTDRPMDTEWYGHLSGYNYACLYDYCTRFYGMSRLTNAMTDAALANLDVLIVKVPTEPFQPAEIAVIERFVERGGGLLLIGEHTDVFNTGQHLNQLSRRFGFLFRYDCLFGMESFFDQYYAPAPWRHPVLQHLRDLDFATSCSIEVLDGPGRGVMVSTALKNSMADYHANNYYPQAVDHAGMRAGAFVQLWAARRGSGRVLAFTDSTIFSNFSAFEPGKSELFLGMLEWLNRRDRLGDPRPFLLALGVALLAGTVYLGSRHAGAARWVLAGGFPGWAATCLGILAYQHHAMPEPKPLRPLTWVTIDRTVCDGPLSKGGFIGGKADGFGIFERWILRLGYFIRRASGPEALRGDLVTFFYPTKPVSPEFREALVRYVENGGRVLVLDSPKNTGSTAGELMQPFGLSPKPIAGPAQPAAAPASGGILAGPPGWPEVPVEDAHEIVGGRSLFRWGGKTVGAVARQGKGTVIAIGIGSRFSDPQMGVTGDVVPDEKLRRVFDLQFTLLRAILRDEVAALATLATP